MKITSDNETLAKNKVLILYTLNKVSKPITNDELYTIVKSVYDLNYFYFEQFLLDLIDAKYIIRFEKGIQTLYEITDAGKKTLDLTIDMLPGIEKLKVDTNFKSNIEDSENEQSIIAEFTPKSENEYEVKCQIVENGDIIFEIKTLAYSMEQAQSIINNWKNNANILYPQLLSILNGSISPKDNSINNNK